MDHKLKIVVNPDAQQRNGEINGNFDKHVDENTIPKFINVNNFEENNGTIGVGNSDATLTPVHESRSSVFENEDEHVFHRGSYDAVPVSHLSCSPLASIAPQSASNETTLRIKRENPKLKAQKMFSHSGGYTDSDVAKIMIQNDESSKEISKYIVDQFNFNGKRIDHALRNFFHHVCLTGETSDRSRLLEIFSIRYFECNPTMFSDVGMLFLK